MTDLDDLAVRFAGLLASLSTALLLFVATVRIEAGDQAGVSATSYYHNLVIIYSFTL